MTLAPCVVIMPSSVKSFSLFLCSNTMYNIINYSFFWQQQFLFINICDYIEYGTPLHTCYVTTIIEHSQTSKLVAKLFKLILIPKNDSWKVLHRVNGNIFIQTVAGLRTSGQQLFSSNISDVTTIEFSGKTCVLVAWRLGDTPTIFA